MTVPDKTTTEAMPKKEAVPKAEAEATTTQDSPSLTIKRRVVDAVGVVATAVTIASYRSGRLGAAPFSLQITATVAGLAAAPSLYRGSMLWRMPAFVRGFFIISWGVTCFVPCLIALIMELFTGHRRPGATLLDAVWRVYAILGLWIAFAMVNERVIRPWWRRVSKNWFGSVRNNSIAVQNQKRAMDRRTAALEGIKARVVLALRRKERAEKVIERRDADIKEATDNVKEAEELLEKARLRASACEADEAADEAQKKEALDKVERLTEMVQTAKLQARSINTDVDRNMNDLEGVEDELKMLQHEWTTALHVEHHAEFAR